MGWFDGWPFKSKEQQERDRLEFERRIFPLGLAQRAAAQAVLDELVVDKRVRALEAMFAFIAAKDCYECGERTPESLESASQAIKLNRRIKGAQVEMVLALVRLDSLAKSLDGYPTAEDVRRVCGSRRGAAD
jgi:hypothetical protein